jgi:hypothetical protein
MKKIHFILFFGLLCFAEFDAQAQRRYRPSNRYHHSQRVWRYAPRPLLWSLGPRVIITTPPLVLGRNNGYRRAYERGYEEGRRRYDEERRRNDDYDRRERYEDRSREDRRRNDGYDSREDEYRRPNDQNQQPEQKSGRVYDEASGEQENN